MVAKNKSYEEFYEEEEKKTSFTRTKNEDEVFYEDDDEEFSTPPKEQQHGSYVQEAIVCVHTLVHRSKVGVVVGLRGRTIFDIERRTGASVSILREEEEEEGKGEGEGKEERVKVVLTGTAQMCKEAAKIIESISDGKIIDEKTTTEKDGRKETYGRRSVSVSRAGDGEKLLRPLEKAFLGWTRKTGEENEDEDSYSSGEEDIISTEDGENDDNGEVEECSFNHHHATTTTAMTTKHRKTPPPYERDASRFFGTLSTATVRIPDAKVALIIGKQGAHIEFLRHMTGCSLNMASQVVDVGDVFLNKDERVFKAATNMAERVLLIESTSLTDVARCVALVADIVEGTLYLQSKKIWRSWIFVHRRRRDAIYEGNSRLHPRIRERNDENDVSRKNESERSEAHFHVFFFFATTTTTTTTTSTSTVHVYNFFAIETHVHFLLPGTAFLSPREPPASSAARKRTTTALFLFLVLRLLRKPSFIKV